MRLSLALVDRKIGKTTALFSVVSSVGYERSCNAQHTHLLWWSVFYHLGRDLVPVIPLHLGRHDKGGDSMFFEKHYLGEGGSVADAHNEKRYTNTTIHKFNKMFPQNHDHTLLV